MIIVRIVSVFKDPGYLEDNPILYKVDLSITYQASIHGFFTPEQDAKFKFRNLTGLTESQAQSVAGLANACYEMGYNKAKSDIAQKLGLL